MRRFEKDSPGESGQALVLFTFMLVVFIGFCALVVDVGRIYAERRYMQNAADAGALAIGGVLAQSVMPCTTGTCSGATYGSLIGLAQTQANSNASLLGGYVTPGSHPEVKVEYATYGSSIYTLVDPGSPGTLLPGNANRVRVTASAKWDMWFPIGALIPTTDPNLAAGQTEAAAKAVVMIAGEPNPQPAGPTWPMVRRRSSVDPNTQSPPGKPYAFWSPNIAGAKDETSGNFASMVDFGLYSIRRDSHNAGYSPIGNLMRAAIDPAKNSTLAYWSPNPITDHAGAGNLGNWWKKGNNPSNDMTFGGDDGRRDVENQIYYGYSGGLSLTNPWYSYNCSGTNSSVSASPDCGDIPSSFAGTVQVGKKNYKYNIGAKPHDWPVGKAWPPVEGDWPEAYYTGKWGQNVDSQILAYIGTEANPNHGLRCTFTDTIIGQGSEAARGGLCVILPVYLWEGAQVYDTGTNTWRPWTANENPDRVHLVDWWYFAFYGNYIDGLKNSEVQGFFVSKGDFGVPSGTIDPPSGKANYYFMVSE